MNNNIRWEDLVFANRNQAYGAYPLRRTYSGRMSMAFAFAMTVTAIMLSYPAIKSLFDTELVAKPVIPKEEEPIIVIQPPPLIEVPPPPPTRAPVQQTRYIAPAVTQQEVTEPPPTNEEIQNAQVSNQNLDGASLAIETSVAPEPPAVPEDSEKVWLTPQQKPEFPGGMSEMMKFIGKHIKYPAPARRMGISGNVFVSFVVNADGSIDKIEIIKGIYADCDNEAMRVIGKMPTWSPGKQNGKAVKVKLVLPIKFALDNF